MTAKSKKPIPMLLAGIAALLYGIGQLIYNVFWIIQNITSYIKLYEYEMISNEEIFKGYLLPTIISYAEFGIQLILLLAIGILFIITFIKPVKGLYCATFAGIGVLGVLQAALALVSSIRRVFSLIEIAQHATDFKSVLLTGVSGLSGYSPFIHWLPAILLTVFALMALSKKTRKAAGKLWLVPVILSAVQTVVTVVVCGAIIPACFGMNLGGIFINHLNSCTTAGFTAFILLAGLGMASMIKNSLISKNQTTETV